MATAEEKQIRRIDVAQAAQAATQYFRRLFQVTVDPTLEEVELSEDGKHWLITLGFTEYKRDPISNPAHFLLPLPKAKFKLFKVDAESGEVLAMKMRSPE